MRILLLTIILFASVLAKADEKESVAIRYFEFLFYEDQIKAGQSTTLAGEPLISSFYSKGSHRMIIVASSLSNGKSYYALMSVNELNMGLLAWKQRGYGRNPNQDIKLFMENDGREFNFEGW